MDIFAIDEKVKQAGGNRYLAVNQIAREARKRAKSSSYKVLDSKLVSSVIENRPVDLYIKSEKRKKYSAYDILNYIDNQNIIHSILSSVHMSKASNSEIFVYDENLSSGEQARVRILTRMLITELNQK